MWFDGLINVHSAVQGIVILSLICTLGLALGKLHIKGISLGIAFVFFVGIVAGHLGLTVDHNMLEFAESFGLTMFVYVLGLYVGPNFFGKKFFEGDFPKKTSFPTVAQRDVILKEKRIV